MIIDFCALFYIVLNNILRVLGATFEEYEVRLLSGVAYMFIYLVIIIFIFVLTFLLGLKTGH